MKVQKLPSLITSGTTGAAVEIGKDSDTNAGVAGLLIPASFAGTAVSFEGSIDGTNYFAIKKTDGTALSYTVAAGTLVSIPVADLAAFPWVKPVSNASETSKTIYFLLRPVA